eukprot:5216334-Karenia_brevis.AAC.1
MGRLIASVNSFGMERARVRKFGPGARWGSRIWALSGPGFENLRFERAKVRGFGLERAFWGN